MMKKSLLTVILVLYSCLLFSQSDDETITTRTWYKKLNNTFGAIATGQSNAVNMVNYVSFDPVNGSFRLNIYGPLGSTSKRTAPFFSLNAGGRITGDNTGVLFSNSKFNSGVSLGGKLHFKIKSSGISSDSDIEAINKKIRLLADQKALLDMRAEADYDRTNIKAAFIKDSLRLIDIAGRKALLEAKAEADAESLKRIMPGDTAGLLRHYSNSIRQNKELENLNTESSATSRDLRENKALLDNDNERKNTINRIKYENGLSYETKREEAEMSVKLKGKFFLWLNITGNVERNKYYTFTDSLSFGRQFSDKKLTTYSFGLEFNLVSFSDEKYRSFGGTKTWYHYLNFGISRIHTNNIGDLSTTELTDSREYTAGDSTHLLVSKYNVYTDRITEYDAWKFCFSYYFSPGITSSYALHAFADLELRNTGENPLNAGAGFVFGTKNKKDDSAVNAEIYVRFVDITGALPQEEMSWIKRNEIGLQFGIPLNFNLK